MVTTSRCIVLGRFLTRLETVHRAQTTEELEAIYRFRYSVYFGELHREVDGVDHERKVVRTDADDEPGAHHFYIGEGDDLVACTRIRVFQPSQVPKKLFESLSLHLFDDIDSRTVAEVARYAIRRDRRGPLVLPSLARATYEFISGVEGVDMSFCYCRPGLVRYYRRMGARPYGATYVETDVGIQVPLLAVPSDHAFHKASKSLMTPFVKKYFGPGKREPLDMSRYAHLFADEAQPVTIERADVWASLENLVVDAPEDRPNFLDALPEKVRKQLADNGAILRPPAGKTVTTQGHVEREIYVVLDGTFEVIRDGEAIAVLTRGDVFGEVAFFRDSGVRSASVCAVTDGAVMMLNRKFLDRIGKSDPQSAQTILFNLARTLSERLAVSR